MRWLTFVLVLLLSLAAIKGAHAASLYLSPYSGSYAIGKTFSVSVYVTSPAESGAINAASGVVSFPADKLELTSLAKSGSIFNLWVEEPSFSQNAGTFNFEGVVLNPGYSGTAGKIITVSFKVKASGTATLRFNSGSVLANDGKGTNVLNHLGSATFTLTGDKAPAKPAEEAKTTPPETKPATSAPTAPQITSATHPDQSKWYASNKVLLSWKLLSGVTAVRLLISDSPTDTPTVVYNTPISSKELTDLSDGIWYFFAQFKNSNGWGPVVRFTLQIDTTPPEPFKLAVDEARTVDKLRPALRLAASDKTSGVDHYLLASGEATPITIKPEEVADGIYTLATQAPGEKTIAVEAFDKAGNKTAASLELTIEGLQPPTITNWPQKLSVGEILTIKGQAEPLFQVILWLAQDGAPAKSHLVAANEQGEFTLTIAEGLAAGNYQLWAEARDSQGTISAPSERVSISVKRALWSFDIIRLAGWLLIGLVVAGLVWLLSRLSWHKFIGLYEKHQRRQRLDKILYKVLIVLRDSIKAQVKLLTKAKSQRRLSKEEAQVMGSLKKTLSATDRFLSREIKIVKRKK